MTLRNRDQRRIVRIDVTTGTVQSHDVLVTGRTVGVGTRCCMVHRRCSVEARDSSLADMAGCAIERRRIDASMTIGASRTRCRGNRRIVVHGRAPVENRLAGVTGRAIQRCRGDILNPLVTRTAVISRCSRGRVVHRRTAIFANNLSTVAADTRIVARHGERIIRSVRMTVETSERIAGR